MGVFKMARSNPLGVKLLAETSEWPDRWKGEERDLALGREIVSALLPFLNDLVSRGSSDKTLRLHFGNAWVLGGEIVREAGFDPAVRKLKGARLIDKFVDEEGGPILPHYATEKDQRSFDATCRKLCRFLGEHP